MAQDTQSILVSILWILEKNSSSTFLGKCSINAYWILLVLWSPIFLMIFHHSINCWERATTVDFSILPFYFVTFCFIYVVGLPFGARTRTLILLWLCLALPLVNVLNLPSTLSNHIFLLLTYACLSSFNLHILLWLWRILS